MADSGEKRPQFGTRFLTDDSNVFQHNAWDNVEWDEEQERSAREKVEKNSANFVDPELKEKYDNKADEYWDKFYNQHQNRFFKDRHWLFTEFPELSPDYSRRENDESTENESVNSACRSAESQFKCAKDDGKGSAVDTESGEQQTQGLLITSNISSQLQNASQLQNDSEAFSADTLSTFPGERAKTRIFEVGCGVGNTVFPILQTTNNDDLFVYCCDLSATAVDLVKEHPDYSPARCHAFVCDVTNESTSWPFPEASLDIIVLIFVMSAVNPQKMRSCIKRLASFLKPGGLIVFRDYGRYDLAQLRFKNGQCLSDNFYVRGDGTQVYFFTQGELRDLFTQAGLVEEQNLIDRRLQVNRGRQLKMYRVWVQCKYRKPFS